MSKPYFISAYVGFCSLLLSASALEFVVKSPLPPMPSGVSIARQYGFHIGMVVLALSSFVVGERYMSNAIVDYVAKKD